MSTRVSELLTERAARLLEDPVAEGAELRQEFARVGLVQIDDFLLPGKALALAEELYAACSPFAEIVEQPVRIVRAEGRDVLSAGFHFARLDPGYPRLDQERRRLFAEKLAQIGFDRFGSELGRQAEPFIRHLTSKEMAYKRAYCFIYREGDYIGPHNDAQTGDRVNLQFPVGFAAVTGLRALHGERFRFYDDVVGSARILGPDVWHEVLPVLRQDCAKEPWRVLISLRYT